MTCYFPYFLIFVSRTFFLSETVPEDLRGPLLQSHRNVPGELGPLLTGRAEHAARQRGARAPGQPAPLRLLRHGAEADAGHRGGL